jgi:glycine/serine hydroxymethyltransferase
MTTRGFKVREVARVAEIMIEVLTKHTNVTTAKKEVKKLALAHPIPESFP